MYNYDQAWSSKKDALAVGFMTWFENGTIAKIDSDRSSDYIELRMVGLISFRISHTLTNVI